MKLRVVMASAIAALSLSGTAFAQSITLNVWGVDTQSGSGDPGYTQVLADEWNAANPDIQIQYRFVPFNETNTTYTRALATNSGPDIFMINTTDTQLYASRGVLVDLTDRIAASEIIDSEEIFPGYLAAVTYDERIWQVPRASDTIGLFMNVDRMKEAGLDPNDPPQSWEELYAYAEAMTDPAKKQFGLGFSAINGQEGPWQWLPFARMAGVEFDNINAPGGVRALEFWERLVDNGISSQEVLVQSQGDAAELFRNGINAMVIQGNWDLPNMEDLPFEYKLALLPPEEEGGLRVSAAGNHTYGISKASEHVDAAFEFIEFMYAQQPRNWNEFRLLPPRAIEVENPVFPEGYEFFLEQLQYGRVLGPHPRWNDVSIALQTAIQSTLSGQTDAQSALDRAAAEIAAIDVN